jgi:hypothetical protein
MVLALITQKPRHGTRKSDLFRLLRMSLAPSQRKPSANRTHVESDRVARPQARVPVA